MYNTTEYVITDIKRNLARKQSELDRLTAMQESDSSPIGMLTCAYGTDKLSGEVAALTEKLAIAEESLRSQHS